MGFWDKLEKAATKFAESAENFEKKANEFLDKNFPEGEPEKPVYSSQALLDLVKTKIRKIAGDRLLKEMQSLDSTTTKLYLSKMTEADGVYDGIEIATATIEQTANEHPDLSEVQYRINLKGMVTGADDYGGMTVDGKYDVELIIDEYARYIIRLVKVRNRW